MSVPSGVWLLLVVLIFLILIAFFIRKPDATLPETIADRDLD